MSGAYEHLLRKARGAKQGGHAQAVQFHRRARRNTLVWLYREYVAALVRVTHFRMLSLDRLDQTCPQCI
jgi:hypothetical protein